MKCLIPVLAMIIFMIQIHAIFIMVPPEKTKDEDNCSNFQSNKTIQDCFNNNSITNETKIILNEDIYDENELILLRNSTPNYIDPHAYLNFNDSILFSDKINFEKDKDEDCSDFLINCLCKCGLAFLAGVLLSDMKFIKFGVI
jgi:hypothetical protein